MRKLVSKGLVIFGFISLGFAFYTFIGTTGYGMYMEPIIFGIIAFVLLLFGGLLGREK